MNILKTKEVALHIGKSVRRTQELIGEGKEMPRLEIVENGRVIGLGARMSSVIKFNKNRKKITSKKSKKRR